MVDCSGRGTRRGEARAGAQSAPDSPHRARVLIHGGISEETPNLSGTPAATCHLHVLALAGPSPLGKILQNFQGRLGLSPRIIPSSTSLIRLRIFRVASILLPNVSRPSLSLSVSCPQFMENKMSSRQLGRQLCPLCPLLIYNEFQFLRKFIENSKNNLARIIKLSLSLGSISPILTKRAKSARRIRIACSTFQPS